MNIDEMDDILDSLFHGCACTAYPDQARAEGRIPPDCDATRVRAYRYNEEALAAKNRTKTAAPLAEAV